MVLVLVLCTAISLSESLSGSLSHIRGMLKPLRLPIIAERLSTRLLSVVSSRLYACIYIYIHHTLIAWVQFLWPHPQTTSHVVLVRPGGDRKIVRVREPKQSRGHMVLVGAGGDRRVKKIVREPKWSRSSQSVIPDILLREAYSARGILCACVFLV